MTKLLGWLRQGDRFLFEEVVRSKIVALEVEALTFAQSVGRYPTYADQVSASLQKAAHYHVALEVIREVEQLEGLTISQPTMPPLNSHV